MTVEISDTLLSSALKQHIVNDLSRSGVVELCRDSVREYLGGTQAREMI